MVPLGTTRELVEEEEDHEDLAPSDAEQEDEGEERGASGLKARPGEEVREQEVELHSACDSTAQPRL